MEGGRVSLGSVGIRWGVGYKLPATAEMAVVQEAPSDYALALWGLSVRPKTFQPLCSLTYSQY